MLEVIGILIFSITLFRIPYRAYLFHLLIASTAVSIGATLVYDVWELHFIASELIVAAITYLSVRVAFKTSWWHTFLIFFTGYMVSGMFYAFLAVIGVADVNHMVNEIVSTITVQFYLFVSFTLLSISLYQKGWGFVFISEKMDIRSPYRTLNMVILITGFFGIIAALLALYLNVNHLPLSNFTIILFLILLIIFNWTIYLLSNKNVEERFTKTNIYKWMN
jgi:hypothetical protein